MKRINIEDIQELHKKLVKFNALNIDEIEFYKNGKIIKITQERIDDFKFTGLNNGDFIIRKMYEVKDANSRMS